MINGVTPLAIEFYVEISTVGTARVKAKPFPPIGHGCCVLLLSSMLLLLMFLHHGLRTVLILTEMEDCMVVLLI